jgi:hypothetical protein
MSVMGFLRPQYLSVEEMEKQFVVVHPLDDVSEEKIDTSRLGPMPMTTTVKLSLFALRGYLVLMMLMVFYHVIDLAGFIHHAK